jgi:hypothetical protein
LKTLAGGQCQNDSDEAQNDYDSFLGANNHRENLY